MPHSDPLSARSLASGLLIASLLAPLAFPLVVCLAWLVAWVQLGHEPRMSQDDPKHVGGLTTWLHGVGWLVLYGLLVWPAVAVVIAGVWASFVDGVAASVGAFLLCVLVLALMYALVFLGWWWWDPANVLGWWLD